MAVTKFLSQMKNFPITLVVITLNEEKAIERCIRSAPFVDEVIVVDSQSHDRTVEIAKSLGAKVTVEPWRGYAKQKIFATSLAKNNWVLSLDADEALSPELVTEISTLLALPAFGQSKEPDAYMMPRLTYHLGRWLYHNGMYPDYQTRLFNRATAEWLDTNVHEKIIAQRVQKLKSPIFHWSFENIAHQIETINKYSSLRSKDFQAKGKKFSIFMMMGKFISKFFETYVVKQGFRDGVPGLIIAVVSAFATFLRWAKLYEMEKGTSTASKS